MVGQGRFRIDRRFPEERYVRQNVPCDKLSERICGEPRVEVWRLPQKGQKVAFLRPSWLGLVSQ